MKYLPFRAVVSDMDGTLLNSHHTIGEFTYNTLEKLSERQVDIVLATGRPYADVSTILKRLNINNITMITSNGAEVHNAGGELLYSNYLPEDIAWQIMQESFDQQNICLNTYQDEEWFINVDVPSLAKYHQDSGFIYKVVDFSKHHARNTQKVFFIGRSLEHLLPLEKQLKDKYGELVSIIYSTPQCLEVMNKNVSKATALSDLIDNRDYELEDCIAFGDGLNDLEMLEVVGKGCTMGNSDIRLIEQLPELENIGFNSDESVASYLRAIFGLY